MVDIDKKKRIDIKKFFKGAHLSFVFVVVFALILLGNIVFGSVYYSGSIREGDISLRTIYAPYDFKYPWGINEKKTEEIREGVSRSIPPIFYIDNAREDSAVNSLKVFFNGLGEIKKLEDKGERRSAILDLKEKSGINVEDNVVISVAKQEDRDKVGTNISGIITSIFPLGITDSDTLDSLSDDVEFVSVKNERIKTERVRPIEEVLTVKKAKNIGKEYAARIFPRDSRLKNNATELISVLVSPNMVFDAEETEKVREEAIKNASPVYNVIEVKKNELILERGKRITRQHIAQLVELGIVGGATHRGPYISGILMVIVLLILLGLVHLSIVEKKLIKDPKEVAVLLINSLFIILVGQFIIQSPQSSYLIPLAGVAMIIALLVSANCALLSTVVLSVFLSVMAGGKMELLFVLLLGGFASVYIARDARKRSKIILAGIIGGIASGLGIIAMGLVNNLEPQAYLYDSLWGLGNGIVSIFLVMGALPLFEYGFKMTTNITLLELSDLNHPLLKELTLKAPGTYQHSIMVGNLAEAACEAIGANSLLARVGAYYHDIGKIGKAEYFSENEMGAQSKHGKLTPSMSALIIVNHVKDGLELAKKYKLNPKIVEFIGQHHGRGLIYYFYQRALEKIEEDHQLNEEEFRYPGLKPQTKESAIVLLADSVEASSRTLSDPTPSRIRGLVQKIINNKFIDNQLVECELTLTDLNKIALSFVRVLTAVFHTRLEYPERKDLQAKKTNGKNKHQQPKQK